MIRHVVMWCFKEFEKEKNLKKAKEELLALKSKIPEIKDIEVGLDFGKGEASYDICLIVTTENQEDLKRYREHPEHVKVAEFIGQVREKRVVADYVLE